MRRDSELEGGRHSPRGRLPTGAWIRLRLTVDRYDPKTIEPKWQRIWADEHTWEVSNDVPDDRPKSYVLEMLPYTSGEPHIGHLKNYAVGDAVAHFYRRHGMYVLHPIGYDAFGLPAENHAIKTGLHPREATDESIAAFREQMREVGHLDRLDARVRHAPARVLPLDPVDLPAPVRARPGLPQGGGGQVVPQGRHRAGQRAGDRRPLRALRLRWSRCKQLEQWFFKITEYADRLLDDMTRIEWPPHVVTMQENWIGRSEGAEVVFRCEELGIDYPVFTTRPDTLFGATFFVLAPGAPRRAAAERLARGARLREPRAERVGRGARRRAQGEDGRGAGPDGHEPGHRRADPDVRGRLRAAGVRHRRGHGRARARHARLRVRRRRWASRSGA